MADEPETDDVLELTEEAQSDQPAEEQGDQQDNQPDAEELVIGFDGEDPDADKPDDSSVIRQLREENRKAKARLRELEQARAAPAVQVGPKPTLESCDFDEEKFEEALDAWKDDKRKADEHQQTAQQQQKAQQEEWDAAADRYQGLKATLAAPDFDDAEIAVQEALGPVSAAIAMVAEDPAKVVYALGKSPAKLAELAKLKNNPLKLAAAVARMEGQIKVTRRSAPKPDTPVRGSGGLPGGTDKQLERLEREAATSGDRSKLIAYKAELKKTAKK